AAEHAGPTAGEYIHHHLTHLRSAEQPGVVDFHIINYDSLFWSILVGIVGLFFLWRVAKKATSGVPGRAQAAVEFLLEMVDNQAKSIVHNATSRKFVGPLALTVFIWILLMNAMDFLPVDLLPLIWQKITGNHEAPLRVVPTADLSATLGMSIGVLLICLYYNIKIKGVGGWLHELVAAPFGSHFLLWPFNFIFQMIEFTAKTVSHGMRLFGNMYAGELVFMLIALMGAVGFGSATGIVLWLSHVAAGTGWILFHALIVPLQAFIFMMLTLVYVGQAHDHH
ncbi:MAG: F0F1 ATP synthase subunit A, partial [Rhizobacter sp.]